MRYNQRYLQGNHLLIPPPYFLNRNIIYPFFFYRLHKNDIIFIQLKYGVDE